MVSAFMNLDWNKRWIARTPDLPDLLSTGFALYWICSLPDLHFTGFAPYRIYSPGLDSCLHEPCRRHAVGRKVII